VTAEALVSAAALGKLGFLLFVTVQLVDAVEHLIGQGGAYGRESHGIKDLESYFNSRDWEPPANMSHVLENIGDYRLNRQGDRAGNRGASAPRGDRSGMALCRLAGVFPRRVTIPGRFMLGVGSDAWARPMRQMKIVVREIGYMSFKVVGMYHSPGTIIKVIVLGSACERAGVCFD
jgi:hypothetical protein